MFGMFKDMAKVGGEMIGTAAGILIGTPLVVIAKTLGVSLDLVEEAVKAGCRTTKEIKAYIDGK